MSAYREDASGLAAHLADLRAAWASAAAQVPGAAQQALIARSRRLWAGRVGVALLALMVMGLAAAAMMPEPYVAPLPPGDLGEGRALAFIVSIPSFALVLVVGFAVAKWAGGLYGQRAARRRIRKLLAADTSAMDPVRALAFLSDESPRRVLAAEGQRLERGSLVLDLAAANWAAFLLGFIFVARFVGNARGAWSATGLFMGAVWALHLCAILVTVRSLRQPPRAPTWRRDVVVTLAVVALIGCFIVTPFVGLLLVVHVVTLGLRATWLRRLVLRERTALC